MCIPASDFYAKLPSCKQEWLRNTHSRVTQGKKGEIKDVRKIAETEVVGSLRISEEKLRQIVQNDKEKSR